MYWICPSSSPKLSALIIITRVISLALTKFSLLPVIFHQPNSLNKFSQKQNLQKTNNPLLKIRSFCWIKEYPMLLQTQSLTPQFLAALIPFKPITKPQLIFCKQIPFGKLSLKCSVSTVSDPTTHVGISNDKPFPAQVSRTIMELSSVGTLSMLTSEGWPLGVGVRFAVDDEGTPVLCLSDSCKGLSIDKKSSLHVQVSNVFIFIFNFGFYLFIYLFLECCFDECVWYWFSDQLEQCGLRTPQCTIQGSLDKPQDRMILKVLFLLYGVLKDFEILIRHIHFLKGKIELIKLLLVVWGNNSAQN